MEIVWQFLSEFEPDQFVEMTLKILNSICDGKNRGKTTIISDSKIFFKPSIDASMVLIDSEPGSISIVPGGETRHIT